MRLLPCQQPRPPASSSGVCLPARARSRGDRLRGRRPSVAVATEAALPAPAGDLSVLLSGCLLLLPASLLQPAEGRPEAQTALMLWQRLYRNIQLTSCGRNFVGLKACECVGMSV